MSDIRNHFTVQGTSGEVETVDEMIPGPNDPRWTDATPAPKPGEPAMRHMTTADLVRIAQSEGNTPRANTARLVLEERGVLAPGWDRGVTATSAFTQGQRDAAAGRAPEPDRAGRYAHEYRAGYRFERSGAAQA